MVSGFFGTPCTERLKETQTPFGIQIRREFHCGNLSIPTGIQRIEHGGQIARIN